MSDLLTRKATPRTPTGFIWETLIVDPRFQDRLHRTPRGKWHILFWALVSGSILVTLLLAASLILEQTAMAPRLPL